MSQTIQNITITDKRDVTFPIANYAYVKLLITTENAIIGNRIDVQVVRENHGLYNATLVADVYFNGQTIYEVIINGIVSDYTIMEVMCDDPIISAVTAIWGIDDEQQHLITEAEISTLARPCYIDHEKAKQFIIEAEQQDVKAKMGDGLWAWINTNRGTAEGILLLDGGEWTDRRGNTHVMGGLKKALAYFTFARIVTGANIEMTRTGAVNRTSDHTMRSDWQERLQVSRECHAIGQNYLDEAMLWAMSQDQLSSICHPHRSDNYRTKIKIIGD